MNKLSLIILSLIIFLIACKPSPQPVNFGVDSCAHCMMTIVEHQFAAELVNPKGKAFKFDAIECLINYQQVNKDKEFPLKLVIDYNEGKGWQNAESCYYLVSENLPSPMGANLSAFKDKASAEAMQSLKEGIVYDWNEIVEHIDQ
jgi:copper chaperone NosL